MREVNAEGSMMRPSSTERRGLIVRKRFIDLILSGKKRFEFRRQPTKYRGRVVLLWRGKAYGTVRIADSLELSPEKAIRMSSDEEKPFLKEYIKGREKIYAWKLEEPVRFLKPISLHLKRGVQTWVRLKEEDIKKVLDAEEEARRKGKESRDS
jgi:predicted transcriptional regulator